MGRMIFFETVFFSIFFAWLIEFASVLDEPTGIPLALRKAKARAPPIRM